MLLIDGVKYELWTPKKEVEEFHPLVKEHYKEIFSKNSIFIEGSKLKSEAGKGSVPDGFVIILDEKSKWYIVEIELSTHELYDHIVNQVGRFINGIKNIGTQKNLIEEVYHHIQDNKQLKAEVEESLGSGEIYKYVSDLITKPPTLVIIIEERTRELDEALDLLRYSSINVIEFQTFIREGAEAVHAHLFEPLYKPIISAKPEYPPPPTTSPIPPNGDKIEIIIREPFAKAHYLPIRKDNRQLFPGYRIPFTLETDVSTIQTYMSSAPGGTQVGDPNRGNYFQANLAEWFKRHPELKVGDRVRISVIELMKKYRLEIVGSDREGR